MSDLLLPVHETTPKLTGLVTFSNFEVYDDRVDAMLADMHGVSRKEFSDALLYLGPRLDTKTFHNKIQNEGLQVLARLLAGDTLYTGAINYGCLGTGTNVVTASDGQLQTEVYRTLYATRTQSSQSVVVDFYYSKSATTGTYREFGVCIDGTATVNSGQFYNRVLTGGWTKTASQGMTVSIQLDLTSA